MLQSQRLTMNPAGDARLGRGLWRVVVYVVVRRDGWGGSLV